MEYFVRNIEYCLDTMQTISNTTSPLKHSIKQQTIPVWNILIALPASAALSPPPARCHCERRAAVNDAVAFVFIIVVVAVIVAVSVTVAAAAFTSDRRSESLSLNNGRNICE
jgi:hypothetical protein